MQTLLQACFGEFFGTFVMILLGNGVICASLLHKTKAQGSGWLTIILGWGLAVAFAIYSVAFYSPAFLNPAIALSFALVGKINWGLALLFSCFEMLGGAFASIVLWFYFYPFWLETKDQKSILSCFATVPALCQHWSNFLSEFLSTALLVGMILAISQYHISLAFSPLLTGLLVMVLGFSLGSTTGFALNPARDFAPRLMHALLPIANKGKSDWTYAWIPFFGPILGGMTGATIYRIFEIFILKK